MFWIHTPCALTSGTPAPYFLLVQEIGERSTPGVLQHALIGRQAAAPLDPPTYLLIIAYVLLVTRVLPNTAPRFHRRKPQAFS